MIVYISIGNSDDKLSQMEWADFVVDVDIALTPRTSRRSASGSPVMHLHGNWRSPSDDRWQNACWCVELDDEDDVAVADLKTELCSLATFYRQDSVAWAVAPVTEFLEGTPQEGAAS